MLDDLDEPRPLRKGRKAMRNQLASMATPTTTTLGAWARANGYDPKTRTYSDSGATAGAIPGAHCGAHRSDGHMKVA